MEGLLWSWARLDGALIRESAVGWPGLKWPRWECLSGRASFPGDGEAARTFRRDS